MGAKVSVDVHELAEFESDFLEDGVIAWCSCGWASDRKADQESASDAWDNHCEQVFMKASESLAE